jgi:site-specific recombinase XerC
MRFGQTSRRRSMLRRKDPGPSDNRSKKTGRPVQFEITEQTRTSLEIWLRMLRTTGSRYLFPSRLHARPHLSTRQYSRLVHRWVDSIGLESISYGTHSMRRTKATQIYRKTGNLRAVQLLLGPYKTGERRPLSRDRGRR